jgi:hypothetical protein
MRAWDSEPDGANGLPQVTDYSLLLTPNLPLMRWIIARYCPLDQHDFRLPLTALVVAFKPASNSSSSRPCSKLVSLPATAIMRRKPGEYSPPGHPVPRRADSVLGDNADTDNRAARW